MLESGGITRLLAQESDEKPLKFNVVAINKHSNIAYVMRHGRADRLRTWRLDFLTGYLKGKGVKAFDVQFKKESVQ